jgi:hypothetical protein
MTHTTTIENELKRRIDLVNDIQFRQMVMNKMIELGVTAEDWNKNAWHYLLNIANEFCAIENNQQ